MPAEAAQSRATGPEDRLVAALGSVQELVAWKSLEGQVMLASAGNDGTIRRWDFTTGAEIGAPLSTQTYVYFLTAWTGQDGTTVLASASRDGIRRWDAASGIEKPLIGHMDATTLAAWTSADGRMMLASGGEDGTIRRWDATSGTEIGEPLSAHHPKGVTALVAWTAPDGKPMLASGGKDGTIRRWDATTGAQVGISFIRGRFRSLRSHGIDSLAAWKGPDGHVTLVCRSPSHGGILRLDATTGAKIRKPRRPLAFSFERVLTLTTWTGPDGHMIVVSGHFDGTIRRWDATAGKVIGNPLIGHTGHVSVLIAWTGPAGHMMLASGSWDGTIRRWDATTGVQVGDPLTGHAGGVDALTAWISADGYPLLASSGADGLIRRWNASTLTSWGDPLPHVLNQQHIVAWTGPGRLTLLAASGYDGIHCWDATTGNTIGKPLNSRADWGWSSAVLAAWTSPDGHIMLASGNFHGIIQRWDATTGTRVGKPLTRRNKNAHITSLVAWTAPDGVVILASLEDQSRPLGRSTIRCWDANTGISIGKPLTGAAIGDRSQSDSGAVVKALAAWTGRDGPILALGYGDGTIRRWDAETGRQIGKQLTGQRTGISAMTAWTGPDGHVRVASGGSDGTILLWDTVTDEQIGEPLTGHTGEIKALTAWTDPDGHAMLASGGIDGVIRVWDTTTGRLLSRVLVEPIRLRGLADRPARDDLLGRTALTQVLANLLLWRPAQPGGETGPGVVTIEGPWGTGKTTIMQLVESRITTKPENKRSNSQLSVAAAHKILRRARITDSLRSRIIGGVRGVRSKIIGGVRSRIMGGVPSRITGAPRSGITRTEYRGALTAWFNAWVSQSSEQVWAGLQGFVKVPCAV